MVRREQTLFLDAITRLYRDGFITDARLQALTREAWGVEPGPDGKTFFSADPVYARVRATQLRALYEDMADRAEIILMSLSRGPVSQAEAAEGLQALGMPVERVRVALLRENLGLVPRTRLSAVATVADTSSGAGEEFQGE